VEVVVSSNIAINKKWLDQCLLRDVPKKDCLIHWDVTNLEASHGALGTTWKTFARRGQGCTDFVSWRLDLWCKSYWISKVFMNRKIGQNYLLFWKIHKFLIACPNTMKQSLSNFLCKELSISLFVQILWHLNLWCKLLNFKGYITNLKF